MTAGKNWKLRLEFGSWVARMRTPPANIAAIHALWDSVPAEVRASFALEADHSFSIDVVMLQAIKLGSSALYERSTRVPVVPLSRLQII